MPAVVVQEAPSLYVSLATGALATGKHRNMPGFEGPLPQLFANRMAFLAAASDASI